MRPLAALMYGTTRRLLGDGGSRHVGLPLGESTFLVIYAVKQRSEVVSDDKRLDRCVREINNDLTDARWDELLQELTVGAYSVSCCVFPLCICIMRYCKSQ